MSRGKKKCLRKRYTFLEKAMGGLTMGKKLIYCRKKKLHSLIKSGGGNGPMKPGNLHFCKVPNPAVVYREMRDLRLIALRLAGRFFCLSGIGSTWTL